MTPANGTRSVASATRRRADGLAGRPRDRVAEMQRVRLLTAMIAASWEKGYARVTVADVIRRARVSRKTFYALFDDREECIREALEQAFAEGRAIALEAQARESSWCDRIRAALAELLALMDARPELANLYLVEVFVVGDSVTRLRRDVLAELARAIDCGRTVHGSRQPPQLTAEGVVGGVLAVLQKRVVEESEEPLVNVLGQLMSMIVLPYLGVRAATRELTRSVSTAETARRQQPVARGQDLLEGLEMRLTYRTMRALLAVAEQPGASNREVAQASGIVDQGQISKLMSRLEGLALIENQGEGQDRGGRNAWYLTARGVELEKAAGLRPRLVA
jgi:AcrR family transcriptional regulator